MNASERQADALEELAAQTRIQNAVLLELIHEQRARRRLEQGALPHEFSAEGLAGSIGDRALELTERVDLDAVDTYADSDLMTDGGPKAVDSGQSTDPSHENVETESEGRGPYDPEELIPDSTPAKVQRTGFGNELVADYNVQRNGWVRVTEWDGHRVKFPPHEVQAVREVQVEKYDDGSDSDFMSRRLADPELIERAREKGAIQSDE